MTIEEAEEQFDKLTDPLNALGRILQEQTQRITIS